MLYIVPTPIGNLEDITLRALNILKNVDLVLAEDTRNSKKLFSHFEIETPLKSHHAHNEHKTADFWVEQIQNGMTIALVSDAGTPGISDPGYSLIKACVDASVEVVCLPGPTAIIPAVVASGLPCNRFYFEGFLPHKKGRQTRIKYISELPCTTVLYESPHRIEKCVSQLKEFCGADRRVVICRELSKLYEEYCRGTLSDIEDRFQKGEIKAKGEIVLILEGFSEKKKKKL